MPRCQLPIETIDLEEISARIIMIAEIAATEHIEALLVSQAHEMVKFASEADAAWNQG